MKKRVQSEIDFLSKLLDESSVINKSHVCCSNLPHFKAIVEIMKQEKDVIAVQKVFMLKQDDKTNRFEVDVVSRNGACWIKAKAMKPEAIQSIFQGNGTFGTKSIVDIAQQLVECASQHYHHFKSPQCVFWFTKGVTEDVAEELNDMGVMVKGKIVDSDTPLQNESIEINLEPITIANLDVTSLIVMVSSVTNGGAHYNFDNEILQTQAEEERKEASLPAINQFLNGKKMIVTQTAWEKFMGILEVIGGDSERQRAQELLQKVTIVENSPSERSKKLKLGPKIKQHHIDIFGTGDQYKASTLTANQAIVRAAAEQGIEFSVFLHPARALTEQKQTL
uniref:DUF1308 domain-containing protein n=1 Tax=Arcella intermedia TaxID=1963864 RepID=A0A6B2L838_9EUKA